MGGKYCSVRGGTSTRVVFPSALPPTFTVCSVSRYAGPARGRILNGDGNWLHGHWSGQVGVAYYEGWKTSPYTSISVVQTDFVIFCGENAGASSFLANGVQARTPAPPAFRTDPPPPPSPPATQLLPSPPPGTPPRIGHG